MELKDLADTQDFDLDGTVGELYGFIFTDDGYYKRVEVGEDRKIPKLEQLRNVIDANIYNGFEYKLQRVENKWSLIPEVNWVIKFEFTSPNTFFDRNNNFRKSFNAGPLHISLIPSDNSRREIALKPFMKRQYLLHRKESVTKESGTSVSFIPKFNLPNKYTMMLDISIRASDKSVSDVLMPGIHISWRDIKKETFRILVAIQSDSKEIQTFISSENVNLSINDVEIDKLDFINLSNLDLIGFYWTDQVLPDEYLQKFAIHSTSVPLS